MTHRPVDPPALTEAARELTAPRVLCELGHFGNDCRTHDELAAVLERAAVHAVRASDGYSARGRYDLAVERRELASSACGCCPARC